MIERISLLNDFYNLFNTERFQYTPAKCCYQEGILIPDGANRAPVVSLGVAAHRHVCIISEAHRPG